MASIGGLLPGAADVELSIPHMLEAQDQNNETQSFDTLKGENGAVLVFVRSTDWCPFCQKQLIDLQNNKTQIEELGYSLIAISYDSVETQKAFSDKHSIQYTLLSDQRSEIIKAFGILNTEYPKGTRAYGIPHPTIYVVDQGGMITNKLAEEGYKKRPPVEAIVEAIKKTRAAASLSDDQDQTAHPHQP